MAAGSIYCLLTENGTAGSYWVNLPTANPGGGGNYRNRYYYDGAYRVYSSIRDWKNACSSLENKEMAMVLEIQGAWTDTVNPYATNGYEPVNFYSVTVTTTVNGVRDPDSFHYGVPGGGWKLYWSGNNYGFYAKQSNCTLDGVEIHNYSATLGYGVRVDNKCVNCLIQNNIFSAGLYGAFIDGAVCTFRNNIVRNVGSSTGKGIYFNTNSSGSELCYNLVYGCSGTGFEIHLYATGRCLYNISIDNATNWVTPATPQGLLFAAYNCGESGDSPADTQSPSTSITVSSSDFTDSANEDYTPVSTGAQIDIHSGFLNSIAPDIIGNPRPSYNYQTQDLVDAGPYEYDHGNGLAPQQVDIELSSMIEGSVLAIYKTSDGSAIVNPTTIGATGSYSTTYSYTGDTQIEVVVRKGTSGTKYLPYKAPGLITDTGFALIVNQIEDTVLNG